MKILMAYDGSNYAKRALDNALKIAKKILREGDCSSRLLGPDGGGP